MVAVLALGRRLAGSTDTRRRRAAFQAGPSHRARRAVRRRDRCHAPQSHAGSAARRDEAVHEGVARPASDSLEECVDCHASGTTGKRRRVASRTSARAATAYAAVKLDCFDCHASKPPDGARIASAGAGARGDAMNDIDATPAAGHRLGESPRRPAWRSPRASACSTLAAEPAPAHEASRRALGHAGRHHALRAAATPASPPATRRTACRAAPGRPTRSGSARSS